MARPSKRTKQARAAAGARSNRDAAAATAVAAASAAEVVELPGSDAADDMAGEASVEIDDDILHDAAKERVVVSRSTICKLSDCHAATVKEADEAAPTSLRARGDSKRTRQRRHLERRKLREAALGSQTSVFDPFEAHERERRCRDRSCALGSRALPRPCLLRRRWRSETCRRYRHVACSPASSATP